MQYFQVSCTTLPKKVNIQLSFISLITFHWQTFLKWFVICQQMAEVDPETLLEWLLTGQGDERDMQLIALEQLCMLLLMSDNVDRCFER